MAENRVPLDIYDNGPAGPANQPPALPPRPYLCILFECCNVYARVYRRPEQAFYHGRCPKCLRPIHLRVARDGTAERFFRAQ